MKTKTKFNIGDCVSDVVTGFEGVITSITVHMSAPNSYFVENLDEVGRMIGYDIIEARLVKCEDDEEMPCDGDCEHCDNALEFISNLKKEDLYNKDFSKDLFKEPPQYNNIFPSKVERLKAMRSAIDLLIKEATNKNN